MLKTCIALCRKTHFNIKLPKHCESNCLRIGRQLLATYHSLINFLLFEQLSHSEQINWITLNGCILTMQNLSYSLVGLLVFRDLVISLTPKPLTLRPVSSDNKIGLLSKRGPVPLKTTLLWSCFVFSYLSLFLKMANKS